MICRNPPRRFLPSWNCIRARSSSTATNRVCCFRRQRAVHKAFACPKSRFLSTPPPSPFHLPGMNLFILPSSIPHAPPSQIFLLLSQTSHSLTLRLFHFSKYQPAPALPGRVSSSVFPAPPGYFIFFPHRCALHPAPVSRNPESKTHCWYPCSHPFLLPKTQKTAASSSLAAVSV